MDYIAIKQRMYIQIKNGRNFTCLQELPENGLIESVVTIEAVWVVDIVLLCDIEKFQAGESDCFTLHATRHPLPKGKRLVGIFLTWLREWMLFPLEMNKEQKHQHNNLTAIDSRKGVAMGVTPHKETIVVFWEEGVMEIVCQPTQPITDHYILDALPDECDLYYITMCKAFDLRTNSLDY